MDNSRYPYIDVCNTINEMKIEYEKNYICKHKK